MRKRMLYHAGRNPPRVGLHASRLLDRISAGRIHNTHAEPHLLISDSLLRCLSRRGDSDLAEHVRTVCRFTEIEKCKQICPAGVPKMRFRVTGYLVPT